MRDQLFASMQSPAPEPDPEQHDIDGTASRSRNTLISLLERKPATFSLTDPPAATTLKPEFHRTSPRIRHGHIHVLGRELATPVLMTAMLEIMLLAVAGMLAPVLRFMEWPTAITLDGSPLSSKIALFTFINLLALISVGFYRRGLRPTLTDVLLRIVGAFILSGIGLGFIYYLYPDLMLGRGILSIAFAIALPLLLLSRLTLVPVLDHAAFARRVLIIGAGELAHGFKRLCAKTDQRGFVIEGHVAPPGKAVKIEPDQIIALEGSLREYAQVNNIDDIVIALDDQRGALPIPELIHCKMSGIQILDVADFLEREAGLLKLDSLRPSTMVFCKSFRQSMYRDVTKRMLDLVAGLGLLLVASPFMLLTALGILIESRGKGSVLYTQTRVGERGRAFTLYKFRSMIMDAEKNSGACWAKEDDPRITRFGNLIRKTRLDELPQLFNVLKGDMSFVGPRPERPEFVIDLTKKLPYYEWRHWVKPGLTGWAQINYPYGASEEDAFQKLQYDLYYVKHQNLTLDILTIMQTVEVVLWGRGSR